MSRLLVALLVLPLLLPAACGGNAEIHANVVRSGFSIRGERIGTGAIVRVDAEGALRDIELEVAFFADGRRVGTELDTLPFCPPRVDCPWGQMLFGEHLGPRWRSIDRVEVRVSGAGGPRDGSPRVAMLATRIDDEDVEVLRSGREGTAYLIAFDGSTPVLGSSFFVTPSDGDLRYSPTLFPRRPGDRVQAVLYPGPVPDRVHGPTD